MQTILEAAKNDIYLQDRDYLEIIYTLAINGFPQYVDEVHWVIVQNRCCSFKFINSCFHILITCQLFPKLRKSMGYNQDAVNFILELANRNQEDVAYKLLLSMPRSTSINGELVPIGQFFLRHMVKLEKVVSAISFCRM